MFRLKKEFKGSWLFDLRPNYKLLARSIFRCIISPLICLSYCLNKKRQIKKLHDKYDVSCNIDNLVRYKYTTLCKNSLF